MFRGSAVPKLEKKFVSAKIWTIIKEICLGQQRMNCNDAIIFWYFERTTHSFQMSGNRFWDNSVNTEDNVIAQILNKNRWCHHRKVLT